MIDNLLGGGDSENSTEDSPNDEMDGGLFEGSEGGGDELMGEDSLMGEDDGMAFGEMGDGEATSSAEVDNRIDELENEVASLSSTVSTVKSENELISESVEDVEENIRKLLEVYEMVTRGVNPFVDEGELGDAFGDGSSEGSMSLFGDDNAEESDASDIDTSVTDADAEEFFDDDFDDDLDDDFDGDFGEDLDTDDGVPESELDDELSDSDGEETSEESGGKSFEELKAEYDSGEAEWDENESTADDDETVSVDRIEDDGGSSNEIATAVIPDEKSDQSTLDEDEIATGEEKIKKTDDTTIRADSSIPMTGGKPYLESLPSGYVADLVVMDWLEFLVEEAGIDGAARTIAYYEAIDWVDESAAATLQTFLNGFGGTLDKDPEPRSALTVTHHNESLHFISRIVNPDIEMITTNGLRSRRRSNRGGLDGYPDHPLPRDEGSGTTHRIGHHRTHEIESDGGYEQSGPDEFFWIGDGAE